MGRPKNFDREQVIENALELFWTKGYSATSLSDLTLKTGLNKKSLYNEFGNKEELFNIVLERYNEIKSHSISLLMQEPLGLNNVRNYLEKLASDTDKKGCLISLSINEKSLLERKASLKVKKDFLALNTLIHSNLVCAFDEEKAKSLSLLISSQLFSVAALGKLHFEKNEIRNMIDHLLMILK